MKGLTLNAFSQNFLGQAPDWYKMAIVGFLIVNPLLLLIAGPFITGWVLVLEFIFTLAMALKCYPLQPGGLLAFEAVVLGMTSPDTVKDEIYAAFPCALVAHIHGCGHLFHERTTAVYFHKNTLKNKIQNIDFINVFVGFPRFFLRSWMR